MSDAITCSIKEMTPEQVLNKLVGIGSDGCEALRVIEVDPLGDICDNYVTCDNAGVVDWRSLVAGMITVDGDGCWCLKVINAT